MITPSEDMRNTIMLIEMLANQPAVHLTESDVGQLSAFRSQLADKLLIPLIKGFLDNAPAGVDRGVLEDALAAIEQGRQLGDDLRQKLASNLLALSRDDVEEGIGSDVWSGMKSAGSAVMTGLGVAARALAKTIAGILTVGSPAGYVAAVIADPAAGGALIPTIGMMMAGMLLWDAIGPVLPRSADKPANADMAGSASPFRGITQGLGATAERMEGLVGALEDLNNKTQQLNQLLDDPTVRTALKRHRGARARSDAEFSESDHPRANNGQFGSGGGGASHEKALVAMNAAKRAHEAAQAAVKSAPENQKGALMKRAEQAREAYRSSIRTWDTETTKYERAKEAGAR